MESEKHEDKGWLAGINNIKDEIVDFKIHLRKVYDAVRSGLMQNREISTYAGYALSKLSCQDSWIGASRNLWERLIELMKMCKKW